jgi:hypothetical protein
MKRGADDHPKLLNLASRLGIQKYAAVGLLEMLWHWTAKYAPSGAIGKYSDADIARGLGWDGDAQVLIESLVWSKFVDHDDEHRIVIHDWFDHADDAVHLSLARSTTLFCGGQVPKLTRLTKSERGRIVRAFDKRTQNARNTHGIRSEYAPPSPPLPSPPLPSPPLPNHQQQQQVLLLDPNHKPAAAAADFPDSATRQRAADLTKRPEWVPDGKPWLTQDAAAEVARSDPVLVAAILRDARQSRNTLKNPAGYIVSELRKMSGAKLNGAHP